MANHASALKAHRQSITRRDRNRSNRSSLKTALKHFREHLEAGRTQDAQKALPELYSLVDKAVQSKVLSANAAARHKSRLTRHLNTAGAEAATGQ